MTATVIADRFRLLLRSIGGAMVTDGRPRFSIHDLRHYRACELYRATKDIYAVSKALGHSGTMVTERYLRSLGQI